MYSSEKLMRLLVECEKTAERGPVIPELGCYAYCIYKYGNFRYMIRCDKTGVVRISKSGIVRDSQFNVKTSDKYDYLKNNIMGNNNVLYHRLVCCMLMVGGFDAICFGDYTVNHMATQDYNRRSMDFLTWRNDVRFLEIVTPELNNQHLRFVNYHKLWGNVVSAYDINKFEKLFALNNLFQNDTEEKKELMRDVYLRRAKGDTSVLDFKNPYVEMTDEELSVYNIPNFG